MSLTPDDLQEIRTIVRSEVESAVKPLIEPLGNEIQALRNDIKEVYDLISKELA